jgi:hypothetical protein
MCKKLILLISVLVLSSISTSQALVVGDFEGGLDGWAPAGDATLTLTTVGATSGAGSVLIEGPGSWQMLAKLDIKAIRSVLGVDGAAISADITAFAEDMQTDWMNMEMIINGQNNDDNGANNNIGWQSLGGLDIVRDGVTQTLSWGLPADLSAKIAGTDDNIAWFELFIVTNNGATNTKIYIDNIQLLGAEPEPEPSAKIVYVDATEGEAGNTTLATGEIFTATGGNDGTDGLWRPRAFGNSATIFEANGATSGNPNDEIVPRLNTTIEVPENNYDVYVYFWADTSGWRIKAALENIDPLPLFIANDPNGGATLAVAEDFEEPVPMLSEGNRTLWQAYLGTTGVTASISVYIDSDPRPAGESSWNERTWYDGIGYKVAPKPEPEPEPAPKIIWVSFHGADDAPSSGAAGAGFTEAPDKAYTDLLTANGYNVTRYVTTSTPDPAILNAADLVIISRSVASSGYQNDGATAWNNISAPMIIMGGYVLRNSRMGYTTGGTMPDTTGDIMLTVNDPTHPIFAGITLTDGIMDNPFAGIVIYPTDGTTVARGISINTDPVNAEGTVLATISEAGNGPVGGMVIGEWPAGAVLTHDGGAGTDTLAGHRLVFLSGSREADGVNSETAGMYDLYADGAQMFLNAVKYMIPVKPVDPGTNGLVAHYAFENDTADSSGNGLDGTIIGDATFVDGVKGMALDFSGDDYVDCGGVAEFSFTDAMTVSTWVNIRSRTTAWMTLVAKGENAWRLAVNNETTGIHYAFSGGTRGWQAANTATELAFDEWYHVAATYDTKVGATVYINGVLDASNPNLDGIDTNGLPLLLGENPEATGRLFDGMLDEVMLYDRALSKEEILFLAGQ